MISEKAKILVESYVQCAQLKAVQNLQQYDGTHSPTLEIVNFTNQRVAEAQRQLFTYIKQLEDAAQAKDKTTSLKKPKSKSTPVTKVKSTDDIIKDIVADQLGLDKREKAKLDMENSLVDDLGCDSLDALEIIMMLEEAFDSEIPDHVAEKCRTLKDLHDAVVVFKV